MQSTGSFLNPNPISIRTLSKSYGSKEILKEISLDVPHKETLVILGRSGTGKSVLLRHILGLEKGDKGSIFIDGQKEEHTSSFNHRIGMLFQGSALFDFLNVEDNVSFFLKEHGDPETKERLSAAEIKKRTQQALNDVELEGFEKTMPSDLSGGQKRRVALARLLIYKPTILLYDEPTTGLDPITSEQITHLINRTKEKLDATSVLITHDIPFAKSVGTIFAFLHEGSIRLIDKRANFFKTEDSVIKQFLSAHHYEEKL